MLRLASDADVHGDVIRGLRRRLPTLDLVRVQDTLPVRTADLGVLAWAAAQNRILITNDRTTMVGFAYQRSAAGDVVPGLIVTRNDQSIASAIDDILLISECMPEEDTRNRVVVFLPSKGKSAAMYAREQKRQEDRSLPASAPTAQAWRRPASL
jgi:hypothetical protein